MAALPMTKKTVRSMPAPRISFQPLVLDLMLNTLKDTFTLFQLWYLVFVPTLTV